MNTSALGASRAPRLPAKPRVLPPARVVRRDARCLLIWDAPAQWLLADEELLALLRLLNGTRTLADAAAALALHAGRAPQQVLKETRAALSLLAQRGLLADAAPEVEAEALTIANITYYLTNRCNLRCRHCYNAERRSAEAPVADVMDALASARAHFAPDITFSLLGGEPTLNPARLLDCLQRAEEIFEHPVLISTNATLIDAALARELSCRNVELQVSLDAPDALRHEALRGPGSWAAALRGLRLLADAGVPVILSMVFDRQGPGLFADYLALGEELGAREVRFIPLRLLGRAQDLAGLRPDLLAAYRQLREIVAGTPRYARLLKRDCFTTLAQIVSAPGRKTGCGLGRKVLFVDADGALYPCPSLAAPEYRLGRLPADDLSKVWLESPILAELRLSCHVQRRARCRGCSVRHWCAGDCRAEAAACGASLTALAPHCGELQRLLEELMWDSDKPWPATGAGPAPACG